MPAAGNTWRTVSATVADDGDVTVEEPSAGAAAVVGADEPGTVAATADDGGATVEDGAGETDDPLAGAADPAGGDDEPHPARTPPTSATITNVACGRRATTHRRPHVLVGSEFTAASR